MTSLLVEPVEKKVEKKVETFLHCPLPPIVVASLTLFSGNWVEEALKEVVKKAHTYLLLAEVG